MKCFPTKDTSQEVSICVVPIKVYLKNGEMGKKDKTGLIVHVYVNVGG